MKQGRKLRLSQCMIVKNEERNIEQALSWGKGIVCEQIVVDTGSTDRTVELAEAMGAKVYHFDWIDDFSAAKNYAIEQASGDWIAFLDADEYFPPEEAKKVLPLLEKVEKTTHYALLASWINVREADGSVMSGGSQVRIFRRHPGLRYHMRIHENLAMEGEKVFRMVDVTKELAIIHTGYDAHVEKNRGKGERNARLIRMDLEEDPENYCLMGYLGDCYCDTEEGREEAKRWYYKAIERMPREPRSMDGRSGDTFRKLLTLLQQEGDERELLRVYDMAVKMLPQESDFDYILGMFYADGGRNYARAIPYLERALSLVETYGNAGGSYLASGSIGQLWYLLALCHYNQGDLSKCLKYCTPLLQSDIYALPPTILFLNALKQGEETGQVTLEQILGLLDKMYPPADPKARIFLVLAARRANYKLLEAHLSARCTKEELACLPEETNENQV